jgi:hypothetical protein
MSGNTDPKSNGVSSDAPNASPAPDSPDTKNGAGSYILLFLIIGLALGLVVGWAVFPELLYSKKNQPIDFNHKLHLQEVGDNCDSCHYLREDGSFSGVPKLADCIDCHSEQIGESEDEARFIKEYVAKNREVPWLIYARQPDCVFFSHAAHINGAKLTCETCHGDMADTESLRPYEENRLSGYSRDIWGHNISGIKHNTWDRMKMSDCAECHANADIHDSSAQTGRDACFVCHK